MKKKVKYLLIKGNFTVKQAMRQLAKAGEKILFVVDGKAKLVGSLTDGDIRRWILGGGHLSSAVENACNKKPVCVPLAYDAEAIKSMMIRRKIQVIPVVNEEKVIEDVLLWNNLFGQARQITKRKISTPVVIMAGGRGTRLDPFTRVLPKPLIPLGDKTIIESIMERFFKHGVLEFHLSINHKSQMIKAYFAEIKLPYKIHMVEENKPLGTAGSLRFLRNKFKDSLMVSNCDIIVETDYHELETFHKSKGYDITIVGSFRHFTIPYGICDIENGGELLNIKEKPEYDFLVNTGMYVLKQKVLNLIPKNEFFNMTDLIEKVKAKGGKVGVFPIDEKSWIDVGQLEEYHRVISLLERKE